MAKNGSVVVFGEKSDQNEEFIYVQEENFQILAGEEAFGTPLEQLMKIEKLDVDSIPFLEHFRFSDFSFWWFLHPTIYPAIKKSINFIEKFQEFLEEKKPSKIIVTKNSSNLDLIEQLCSKHNVDFEKKLSINLKNKLFNNVKNNYQEKRYQKIYSKKTQTRKSMFTSKFDEIPDLENKIVFAIPTIYHRKLVDYKTGTSYDGEYVQQNIINHLIKNHNLIGIDLDYTFKGDFGILEKRFTSNMDWVPVEVLLSEQLDNNFHDFFTKYNNLIENKNFQKLFEYDGISLWKTISNIFKMMNFAPYIPSYLKFYVSLVHLFEKQKPKMIFLSYETGPYALAILLAAQKHGITTIGVAHGTIDKYNPMYSYDQIRNNSNLLGFPIPDKTLVHGNFSKNTMINQGYPSNQILVYGNPTFFHLDKLKKLLEQKKLFEKFGISKNQKIILYGTEFLQEYYSAQGKYNYNTLIWKRLLQDFGNKPDYFLILKPHPNENTSIYDKVLHESQVSNAQIINDDLFELIYISSIVVSVFSNIMTDALCFEKPVIRVTFDNIKHTVPYEKYNVVQSTNLNKLSENITKFLSDSTIVKKLQKNLAEFLFEQNNIPEDNPNLLLDKIVF